MLINDFFNITDKANTDEGFVYNITLNKDHQIYKGHFPDMPIAPGVCLAQVVKELCENHLGQDLKMVSSRSMKFMSILDPNKDPDVSVKIRLREEDNVFIIRASCQNETTSFFKIDAKYAF